MLILLLFSISEHDCIFTKIQNLKFAGEDLAVCPRHKSLRERPT